MSLYLSTAPRPTPQGSSRKLIGQTSVELKAGDIAANGSFSGYGAIFGNRDDGGDIIEPGFFAPVLGDFLREGFFSWDHDWANPVAMPTAAREDSKGLWVEGRFHSNDAAQKARTIASERLAAGLSMGLSIGYEIAPGGATIEKDGRHLRTASRLFEVGLVTVPMNRQAGVTDVKSRPLTSPPEVSSAGYQFVDVPGPWVDRGSRHVVEKAVGWAAWSLHLSGNLGIQWYDSVNGRDGQQLAAKGAPVHTRLVKSPAHILAGFADPDRGKIGLKVGRRFDELALTTMHELGHMAGMDEADAAAFAAVLFRAVGGLPGLMTRWW